MRNGERKAVEQHYHDRLVRKEQARSLDVYDGEFLEHLKGKAFARLGDVRDKSVLIYGSGVTWDTAHSFGSLGAATVMIDLSFESTKKLGAKIRAEGADGAMKVLQMDCEQLGFRDGSFDGIYGRAILHHLDLARAGQEIARVLKPGGRAVFLEPLNQNPFINLFRALTPGWRTPTEHPLSFADIEALEGHFRRVTHQEFALVAVVGIAVNSLLRKLRWASVGLAPLFALDSLLLRRLPFLGRFCWNTIILCET